MTTFNLEQLEKFHSTPSTALTAIHDNVYDIAEFSKVHPGGRSLMLLSAGKDATILFETYHPQPISDRILEKLLVGTLSTPTPTIYSFTSPFYKTLKTRVCARLRELEKPRRGSPEIYIKAAFILVSFWSFLLLGCFRFDGIQAVLSFIAMGYFASLIGTCIQHDGNHGAFSPLPKLNTLMGGTMVSLSLSLALPCGRRTYSR